jgi:iron(III) transport system substrate-binding protein
MSITRTFPPAAPFLLAAVLAVTACGSSPNTSTGATGTRTSTSTNTGASTNASTNTAATTQLTLYTSVTQNTITAVLGGFETANPNIKVSVFRATTGQLNARIAADEYSGGLRADVIWGTDPLSMESYAQEGLFQPWPLPNLTGVPSQDKTTYFWGTRELYLVIVAHKGPGPDAEDLVRSHQRQLPGPGGAARPARCRPRSTGCPTA